MTDQPLKKGQTVYVVDGLGFMPSDQIVHVEKREVKKVINPESFTVYATTKLYGIGDNAYYDRGEALERALRTQAHRVVLVNDRRVEHLKGWEALIQEFSHELPDGWDRENFNAAEFTCKHKLYNDLPKYRDLEACHGLAEGYPRIGDKPGEEHMDRHFIERLQLSRKIAGIPYNLNSGWRCEFWNAVVGGLPNSSHMIGLAADIEAVTSRQRYAIVGALIEAGFKRIGIRKDFIHVDDDPAKPQGIIWLY